MKLSSLIKLGLVATALVMIPRRSSKNADCVTGCGCTKLNGSKQQPASDDNTTTNAEDFKADANADTCKTNSKCCDNKKNCKCPLCRFAKCPLCAIGKCFCCKNTADKADKKACCGSDKKSEK